MSISETDVEQIAQLARLELTPPEKERLVRDLGSIIDHIQELEAVLVDGVEPMRGVSDHPAPMRSDQAGADPLVRPVGEIAPDSAEGFFIVPRLPALDNDSSDDLENVS